MGFSYLQEDLASVHVAARHFDAAFQVVSPSPPPSTEMAAVYAKFHRPGASIAVPTAAAAGQ